MLPARETSARYALLLVESSIRNNATLVIRSIVQCVCASRGGGRNLHVLEYTIHGRCFRCINGSLLGVYALLYSRGIVRFLAESSAVEDCFL